MGSRWGSDGVAGVADDDRSPALQHPESAAPGDGVVPAGSGERRAAAGGCPVEGRAHFSTQPARDGAAQSCGELVVLRAAAVARPARGGSPRRKSRGRPGSASAGRARAASCAGAPNLRCHSCAARSSSLSRSCCSGSGRQLQAVPGQLHLDAPGAQAGRAHAHAAFDEAFFAEQALGLQPVEQLRRPVPPRRRRWLRRRARHRRRASAAAAPRAAACAATRCGCVRAAPASPGPAPAGWAGAASCVRAALSRRPCPPRTSGTPMASRTLFSISTARSRFSRRNSRALSLPWPIFSPL